MANYSREPRGDAAMSFEEIGSELKISSCTAQKHFHSGMRKLQSRRRTPSVQNLLRLVESKAMLR